MKPWSPSHLRMFLLAMGLILLDQATKFLVILEMKLHQSIGIIPGLFNLTYVQNTGAAWGMFRSYPHALAVLAVIALIVLMIFAPAMQGSNRWTKFGWMLLVGGISGNLIDRIRLGSVTDFLDFYIRSSHWPAFNIADSAICAGVICYLIDSFSNKSMSCPSPQ